MHAEKPAAAAWVQFVLFLSFALVLAGVVIAIQDASAPPALIILVLAVMLWAIISFQRMEYSILEGIVRASFWPFSIKIPVENIAEVEVRQLPWYVGIGFRLGPSYRAMTTRYGTAVKITRKDSVIVYLTPNNPEQFSSMLRRAKK